MKQLSCLELYIRPGTRKNEDVSWDPCPSEGVEINSKENLEGLGNKWWLVVSEEGIFKLGIRRL